MCSRRRLRLPPRWPREPNRPVCDEIVDSHRQPNISNRRRRRGRVDVNHDGLSRDQSRASIIGPAPTSGGTDTLPGCQPAAIFRGQRRGVPLITEMTCGTHQKTGDFDALTKDLECSILDPIATSSPGSMNGALLCGSSSQPIGAFGYRALRLQNRHETGERTFVRGRLSLLREALRLARRAHA